MSYTVIAVDHDGFPRCWGTADTEAEARAECEREVEEYLADDRPSRVYHRRHGFTYEVVDGEAQTTREFTVTLVLTVEAASKVAARECAADVCKHIEQRSHQDGTVLSAEVADVETTTEV